MICKIWYKTPNLEERGQELPQNLILRSDRELVAEYRKEPSADQRQRHITILKLRTSFFTQRRSTVEFNIDRSWLAMFICLYNKPGKGRLGETYYLLVHFLDAHNDSTWARHKPAVRVIIQVSHMGGRNLSI